MPGGKATAGCPACHCSRGSSDVIMTLSAPWGSPAPKAPVAVSSVLTSGLTTISCIQREKGQLRSIWSGHCSIEILKEVEISKQHTWIPNAVGRLCM